MFEFFSMAGTYEERKVDNYSKDGLEIDTCLVTDSRKDYETGIRHPDYNGGKWVIVELYDTTEEAKAGHSKWLDLMINSEPEQLVDVSSCELADMLKELGDSLIYKKEPSI